MNPGLPVAGFVNSIGTNPIVLQKFLENSMELHTIESIETANDISHDRLLDLMAVFTMDYFVLPAGRTQPRRLPRDR